MKRYSLIAVFFLLIGTGSAWAQQSFFRTSGQQILDGNGNPYLARGVVLSGWLIPEAYGLRINDVHNRHMNAYSDLRANIESMIGTTNAQIFWNTFESNYVTKADIAEFASLGFNTVRVPFNYRTLSPENAPGTYTEAGFQKLDKIIAWCKTNGMSVLLDMHACPGGQSHDPYANPEHTYWYWDAGANAWLERGVAVLWESNATYFARTGRTPAFNKQRTADIWRQIANRYKNEKAILGYELINEPYFYESSGVTTNDMRALFIQITAAIRQVDTNHILFVEGNKFAEFIDGLTPPWDSKMVVSFHRYWRQTGYEDGVVQSYLNARSQYNVPLMMTESGENSGPWFYEIHQLMRTNNIGSYWWGYKKVDSIACEYFAQITPDYQYVINNWRDSTVDPVRARKGFMELADRLSTTNCAEEPGFFASLRDPLFNVTPQAFAFQNVPGVLRTVYYDVGNQNVAYHDTRYKNETYMGEGWNLGWTFRNDGVDIMKNGDTNPLSIGYHVGYVDDGEWLKYTVNVRTGGNYRLSYRVATPWGGKLQLWRGTNNLTGDVNLGSTGGWGTWQTQVGSGSVYLPAGTNVLQLKIITGGFDISWIEFASSSSLIVNGALTGSGSSPANWANWNDGSHDADTGTYRSSGNSWAFWWDGGIYQNITNGFASGSTLTFGGWLYTPGWDALRNGSKHGVIQIEFYNGSTLVGTGSTPVINRYSAQNTWLNVEATATVPAGTTTVRLVIRCNDCWSGDGRFMVDDVYVR
jgi:endoglucanase